MDLRHKKISDLIERESFDAAWAMTSDLMNEDPDDAKALYFSGVLLRKWGHIGIALQMFRRALGIVRNIPNIWMHYAACLHDTNKYEEAREAFLIVQKALPHDPMPIANVAATYVQECEPEKAVEWADKALAIDPDHRIARVAKAFGELGQGHWAKGWEYADALYGEIIRQRIYRPQDMPEEPQWNGMTGQTVVVQADQGLGEMIMFMQMLPQMAEDCKKLIVEVNPRLVNLYKRNLPASVDVYGTLKQDEGLTWPLKYDIDAHIHISHIGKYYRKKDEDFPRTAYITPDPEKAAKWRKWLEQFPKPWTGIAWLGGIARTNQAVRSMPLQQWAPILNQGGTFVSLAYQNVGLEVARWNVDNNAQVQVPDINNDGDFDEWVALISQLDHVVSVLTTVVHVCGALGKKVQVLCPRICQWQHAYGGDGMIWYPVGSVQNYRQVKADEGWSQVIAAVASDYGSFVVPRFAEAA